LAPVLGRHPGSLLWYALCAGLRRRGAVFASHQGLGRLVFRELSREHGVLDVPLCDIALGELEVLSRTSAKFPDIRTVSTSYVDVELIPFVTCSFSTAASKENGKQGELAPAVGKLDSAALGRRIEVVIDALENLQDEIS